MEFMKSKMKSMPEFYRTFKGFFLFLVIAKLILRYRPLNLSYFCKVFK